MNPIIAVCISLGVVGLAYFIKHFAAEIIEDEHHFLMLIAGFLAVYITAAVALSFLLPTQPLATVSAEPSIQVDTVDTVDPVRLDSVE